MTHTLPPSQAEAFTLLNLLAETWPECFRHDGDEPVPLAVGIRDTIAGELGGLVEPKVLNCALRLYVNRIAYRHCLISPGAQRYGLDGQPVEPVSPEDQAKALANISAWHDRHKPKVITKPVPKDTQEKLSESVSFKSKPKGSVATKKPVPKRPRANQQPAAKLTRVGNAWQL